MFTAVPLVRLNGQEKPQIAPSAKSDSFERDENGRKFRVQHREAAETNFRIAGVDLAAREEVITQAARLLGKVKAEASGDASTFLGEVCYQSTNKEDSTQLYFARGEVAYSFVLSSEMKASCKPSQKITRSLATASGIHLGQSQEQVIEILGLPTRRYSSLQNHRDNFVYELQARKMTDPQDLAQRLVQEQKKNPYVNLKEFHDNYDFYDLSVSIQAKFVNNGLTNLKVSWMATY
jgi:hypothetical protein